MVIRRMSRLRSLSGSYASSVAIWLFGTMALLSTNETLAATAPTVNLTAWPTALAPGATTKLWWGSTNATSCTASGGWWGAKTLSGNQTTSGLTATTTFKLTCTGAGGSKTAAVKVTVGPAPTVTLSASPNSVPSGGTSKLTWSSTNATSCS